jgi:hypothetical protein
MADYHPDGRREQIHLPGPSLLPFAAAVGITVALMGLIISWWIVGLGAAVLLLTVVRWVQTVRLEIDSLPSERQP